jgi:hypothetical protein
MLLFWDKVGCQWYVLRCDPYPGGIQEISRGSRSEATTPPVQVDTFDPTLEGSKNSGGLDVSTCKFAGFVGSRMLKLLSPNEVFDPCQGRLP